MRTPVQCLYWKQPELAFGSPMVEKFRVVERLLYDEHWRRYLLTCKECGQRYFYEFYEEVDWSRGEDAQRVTLIPVETEDETETVKRTPPSELHRFSPRLERTFPSDAERPATRWIA